MAWNRGRYYTQSRKVNGRVVREYVGGGQLGVLASQLDTLRREEREEERDARKAERKELEQPGKRRKSAENTGS